MRPKKRFLEAFLLLCLVALFVRTALRLTTELEQQRTVFEPSKFSIEGVTLESTIQEVTEKLGEPQVSEYGQHEYTWDISVPEGRSRELVIRTNLDGEISTVWGEVLGYDGTELLRKGQPEREWFNKFGVVETEEIRVPMCGYSRPQSDHPYFYPDYRLNICGKTEGFFWKGSVRANSFALSAEPVEFYLGFLGFRPSPVTESNDG